MREIKFRGLRVDNNEWIYGTFIVIKNVFDEEDPEEKIMFFDSKWIAGCEVIGECWIEVNPETVGQFTGLKDKNGVGIYEGDIINYSSTITDACEVIYKVVDFRRKNHEFNETYSFKEHHTYIVIGNIHQNPSML